MCSSVVSKRILVYRTFLSLVSPKDFKGCAFINNIKMKCFTVNSDSFLFVFFCFIFFAEEVA